MSPEPITVVVEQPFDWVSSVVVPVAAILISACIAIGLAMLERRASERSQTRAQAAELIRALAAMGRAARADRETFDAAAGRFEQELNAFATHLNDKDLAVAKFVCEVIDRTDVEELDGKVFWRVTLWVSTALELWVRGVVSSRDFADNMPKPLQGWVEHIDLGDWNAASRGQPVRGLPDLPL